MSAASLKDIKQLLTKLVVPMYLIERIIPVPTDKVRRDENNAEHSWSVAMLSCCLAPLIDPSLDVGKICQYATIHDLPEVYAGDTPVWGNDGLQKTKEKREAEAVEKVKHESQAFPWVSLTLDAYWEQKDDESKFVRAVDKLITLYYDDMDEGRYYQDHKITSDMFETTMSSHRQKAHSHPTVGMYYEEIRKVILENPSYWYRSDDN